MRIVLQIRVLKRCVGARIYVEWNEPTKVVLDGSRADAGTARSARRATGVGLL